ncbi:hypothetical protein DYBT9623_00942 [Dyadobacter sp. CECT 9623]|uniref:Secretion system C-terminal sorting domain-containing protein n=1 Tax=Dyadobacter linearis TaxID=2823330 RepID=A0ABN7R4X7_9BACT|nr:T9SS type A sorting domain-containing protein [Dyadobacter sp. CECT 9623]CAG5068213.1 hypothetical protein DYBT9623_00942 [Dyadobacter sp. CECT 9623]
MMHFLKCGRGKLCLFLLLLLCVLSTVSAQDYIQQRDAKLNALDLTGLGKTLFLNAAITDQHEVNHYRNLAKSPIPDPERVTSAEWQNLYERLMDADFRPNGEKLADFEKWMETDPAKITKNDTVPIGIMNLEGIYLTGTEITENEAQKKAGNKADFVKYERVRIVSASVLKEDLYQADVIFKLSPGFYFSNQTDQVKTVEIDFGNGKGYRSFTLSEQLIPHRFETEGEHLIHIRLTTGRITYRFETKVNVLQMERIKPFAEFQITANKIYQDTADNDRSARTALVGGNVRILLGCDQILNKPIIIAEGFDMGQDIFLDFLEAKYRTRFNRYLAEGYDLVFLDYSDGRAAIQNNAQVLKALIQQVNTMKTGSAQSVVIGESMSGLVARWALRQMENEGLAHQVKLMLCYDTPHQGANVPVGLTQLMHAASPTLLTKVILKFFAKGWRNYYLAMSTPAALQLLMHQTDAPNIGGKHPEFDLFRTQLVALGNGGYPQNCRNIAVTHGSMDAGDLTLFNDYQYGSRILRSWTPFGLQNTNIDIHTSHPGQNTNVLRFASWGIFSKAIGINRKYNSPLNDDFLPGGRTNAPVPNKLFNSTKEFEFCFVPTFSAIDYTGPRVTQADRELLNVTAVNAQTVNRKTPFAAIYGNNENTEHVEADDIEWGLIGEAENLLTGIAACPALPVPPVPTIMTYPVCHPFDKKRTTEDNTAFVNVSLASPSNGLYIHNWTVAPGDQHFTTTGDQITFRAESVGLYQITCVRTYPGRRDISSTHSVGIFVADCKDVTADPETPTELNLAEADVLASDVWENDFLLTTVADLEVFAHYIGNPKILYATLANGTFVPRTTLLASGMFEEFSELFAATDPRIPLPVRLKTFTVNAEGKTALLEWKTESETNSSHFEIERSNTGKDWFYIGKVQAENIPDEPAQYQYADQNITAKHVYYRLKMVDGDSTFAYSQIRSLAFDRASELAAYPNPIGPTGEIQLLLGDVGIANVRVFDLAGKLVSKFEKANAKINIEGLPSGKYILQIGMADGTKESRTIVKE